jgi:hypothetical protein
MKVEINLPNAFIDKLLERYGYMRKNVRVGYTIYAYRDDELESHLDCVSYYNKDIAYRVDKKPEFLDSAGLITPSMIEEYELEKVVGELFNKALVQTIAVNIF